MPNNDIQIKIEALNYAKKEMEAAAKDVRRLGTSAQDAAGGYSFLAGKMRAVGIAAGVTFSVSSIIDFGKAAFNASLQVEKILKPIEAIEQINAPTILRKLREEADRLGQNFYDIAPAWGQISAAAKGTSLEGEKLFDVFSAVNEAAMALALGGHEVKGMLYAVMQMISKGTVTSEELKRQLGDRLPGAFKTAAKAMGVTTAELGKIIESGELLATDFLPKLATALHEEYGEAAINSASESQKAVNKFNEAWTELKANLVDSELAVAGIKAVTGAVEELNDTIRDIPSWEHLEAGLATVPDQLARINEELEKIERGESAAARRKQRMRQSFVRTPPGFSPYGQTGVDDPLEAQKAYLQDVASVLYAAKRSMSAMEASNRPPVITEDGVTETEAYKNALQDVRRELELVGKSGRDLEIARLNQDFEKQAEVLGKTNKTLVEWREARTAAIDKKYDEKDAADEARDKQELARLEKQIERATLDRFEVQRREARRYFAELKAQASEKGLDGSGLDAGLSERLSEINRTEKESIEEGPRKLREELALIGKKGKALELVKLDQWFARAKREAGGAIPELHALYDAQKQIIEDQYRWEGGGVMGELGKGFEDLSLSGQDSFGDLAGAAVDSANQAGDALNNAIWGVETNWKDSVRSMAMELSRLTIQQNLIAPVAGGMSGFFASIFHEGGVVGGPAPVRFVPADTFNGAKKFHSGGLVGDEMGIIAKRGEEVLTEDDPRHIKNLKGRAIGGSPLTLIFKNNFEMPAPSGDRGQDEAYLSEAAKVFEKRARVMVHDELRNMQRPGGQLAGGVKI